MNRFECVDERERMQVMKFINNSLRFFFTLVISPGAFFVLFFLILCGL